MFVTEHRFNDMKRYLNGRIADYQVEIAHLKRAAIDVNMAHIQLMDMAAEEIKRLNAKIAQPCTGTYEVFYSDENVFIEAASMSIQDGYIRFHDTSGRMVGCVPGGTLVVRVKGKVEKFSSSEIEPIVYGPGTLPDTPFGDDE